MFVPALWLSGSDAYLTTRLADEIGWCDAGDLLKQLREISPAQISVSLPKPIGCDLGKVAGGFACDESWMRAESALRNPIARYRRLLRARRAAERDASAVKNFSRLLSDATARCNQRNDTTLRSRVQGFSSRRPPSLAGCARTGRHCGWQSSTAACGSLTRRKWPCVMPPTAPPRR